MQEVINAAAESISTGLRRGETEKPLEQILPTTTETITERLKR